MPPHNRRAIRPAPRLDDITSVAGVCAISGCSTRVLKPPGKQAAGLVGDAVSEGIKRKLRLESGDLRPKLRQVGGSGVLLHV